MNINDLGIPISYETPFIKQHKSLQNIKKNNLDKSSIITIDSRFRNQFARFNTRQLSTSINCIKIHNEKVYIIFEDLYELIENNNINEVPDNILIILIDSDFLSIDSLIDKKIAGIPYYKLLYNNQDRGPLLSCKLYNYNKIEGTVTYVINNISINIKNDDVSYNETDLNLIVKRVIDYIPGYNNPNFYNIQFKSTYHNIIGLRIISSEFPNPKTLGINSLEPNYTFDISIPELKIIRTITLDIYSCNNPNSILNELIKQINKNLYEFFVYPFLTNQLNKNLVLLYLSIKIENILITKKINDNKVILLCNDDITFPQNDMLLLNTKQAFGFYRNNFNSYYLLEINLNIEILPEIPKLSNIYIDNDLVGFYSESYTEDGLYFFKIYTENLEAFQVGNRLNLGTLNVVFTIVNTTLIGNNLCLILDRVKKMIVNKQYQQLFNDNIGIFNLLDFKFIYPLNSIILRTGLKDLDQINKRKMSKTTKYYINGNIYNIDNNTRLQLKPDPLKDSARNYQIINIKNRNSYINRNISESLINYNVILCDLTKDGNIRCYLRETINNISIGTWVKVIYNNCHPNVLQIIELTDDNTTIILKNYDSNDLVNLEISSIKLAKNDINILRGFQPLFTKAILTNSILRSENKISILYTNDMEFLIGSIIKIGETDNNSTTNTELNIVTHIDELSNNEMLITLKYPITNSRLKGTIITGFYLYFTINPNLINKNTITITSNEDLSHLKNISGSINWLSNTLIYTNNATRLVDEEPIFIDKILKVNNETYTLVLKNQINNMYNNNIYIVLFINSNLENIEPSTFNFKDDSNNWITAIRTVDNIKIDDEITLNIYGMTADNIPVYGLSDSDVATRGINNIDNDLSMELVSDNLTYPDPIKDFDINKELNEKYQFYEEYMDNKLLFINGRFTGRGGLIHLNKIRNFKSDLLDVSLLDFEFNKTNPNLYLSNRILPKEFSINKNDDYIFTVVSNDTNETYSENYTYFYICCKELQYIQQINDLSKHKLFNNEDDNDSNGLKKYLNNIIAVVQVNIINGLPFMFNTVIPINLDFTSNPIRKLSSLTLIYLWPNGQLVDFNSINHSFTIEIVEKSNTLTHINPVNGMID